MSTFFKPPPARSICFILLSMLWLAACASAWDRSTMSGGNQLSHAKQIVAMIEEEIYLTPACRMLATDLTEAGIKARIAARRPTAYILSRAEQEMAALYIIAQCPQQALVGLTFGMAETANRQTRMLVAAMDGLSR